MKAADWGVWAGALGTVGTLMGTIWLATEERRRRDREMHDLAVLAAFQLVLKIGRTIGSIQALVEIFEASKGSLDLAACGTAILSLETWGNDELLPLIALPNNTAVKLAAAPKVLETIGIACKNAAKRSRSSNLALVEDLLHQLRSTERSLEEASAECRRLASTLDHVC